MHQLRQILTLPPIFTQTPIYILYAHTGVFVAYIDEQIYVYVTIYTVSNSIQALIYTDISNKMCLQHCVGLVLVIELPNAQSIPKRPEKLELQDVSAGWP